MIDHEQYRFGSASWASEADLRRAGLFGGKGLPIGYFGNNPLHLDSDAPILTIGGAGSGKLRDILGYVVCTAGDQRMLIFDPRGELAAISLHNFIRFGASAWCWNPVALHGHILPQHRLNPLDILKPGDPRLHADCKAIAESLIPLPGGDKTPYFEQRARQWLEVILRCTVERKGGVDFPLLHRTLNMIEGDPHGWADVLQFMLTASDGSARRTATEMLTKQQDTPKEFGAILGTLYANLGWLDDPMLLASLSNADVSLSVLAESERPCTIFLNIPTEYIGLWSPLLRTIFTVTMRYKERRPQAPRVTMIVDEAGQMGHFEALLKSFTYGRGAGIRAWAVFQDLGQIIRNFGSATLQSFIGSAQLRQFVGVRDYQTAQLVSQMLGSETLDYDDTLRQGEAERHRRQAAIRIMQGDDPFAAALDFRHYEEAAQNRSKQQRLLMSPDEVLAMPEDRQILFISGKNLKPVYAHKYPYFSRREMAGLYLPNPFHPPLDRVRVATRWGEKWLRVMSEPVPPSLAHYPQYQGGTIRYVEGHRPF